jgi:hypothetical protein
MRASEDLDCATTQTNNNRQYAPGTACSGKKPATDTGLQAGSYWLSSIPGEADPESTLLSGFILWPPPAIQNPAHMLDVLAWPWYRLPGTWMSG